MIDGKRIGMLLFIGGIILLIIYGLILGYNDIIKTFDIISGLLVLVIFIGLVVLVSNIIIEQRRNLKDTMKDIKKEDLEPWY